MGLFKVEYTLILLSLFGKMVFVTLDQHSQGKPMGNPAAAAASEIQ